LPPAALDNRAYTDLTIWSVPLYHHIDDDPAYGSRSADAGAVCSLDEVWTDVGAMFASRSCFYFIWQFVRPIVPHEQWYIRIFCV